MNEVLKYPHIYKKDKYVKLKSLEPKTSKHRQYVFAADNDKSNISSIAKHCNNINQVVARNWLKLSKLLSYLGLEKDESDNFSKKKSPFNHFFKDLLQIQGEKEEKTNLIALEEISKRLEKLAANDVVTNAQLKTIVKDFDERLTQIQDSVKAIIG